LVSRVPGISRRPARVGDRLEVAVVVVGQRFVVKCRLVIRRVVRRRLDTLRIELALEAESD
jgi:hypothetical protein